MPPEAKLLRAPQPCEAIVVSGPGLAEGLRLVVQGNPMLDHPSIWATIDRIDRIWHPIGVECADMHVLFNSEGPIPDGLTWCLPDTGVAIVAPSVEGLLDVLDSAGITNVRVVVDRRYIELIEDPGSSWPWETQERTALASRLGLSDHLTSSATSSTQEPS